MDPAIHAAIVEGLVGGSVVFGGIAATEVARRAHYRREKIEELTMTLGNEFAKVLAPLTEDALRPLADVDPLDWGARQGVTPVSEWSEVVEQVCNMLAVIRAQARWPLRNAKEIRWAAERKLAAVSGMTIDVRAGVLTQITLDQYLELNGPELTQAVYGSLGTLDGEIAKHSKLVSAAQRATKARAATED